MADLRSTHLPLPLLVAALATLAPACGDDGGGGGDAANGSETSTNDSGASTRGESGPTSPSTSVGSSDGTPPGESTEGNGDTQSADTSSDGGTTGEPAAAPPTNVEELLPWLEAGMYLEWPTESAVHGSAGPHFGDVRTFINPALLESLENANASHPVDAAAVKELYGGDAEVGGWSVIVKVADGAGGDTWYFLEHYEGTTYGNGVGDNGCTGCHGTGSLDFFKSPFPLQ